VKTTETIRIAPRVKQIVVGKLELPKGRESPELVCVETAQLPFEGVLAARGLARVVARPLETSPQRTRSTMTSHHSQLRCDRVPVMLVNFSHEEIELHRATVLGATEETWASLVALINDS
jgi:hypothetical protein